MRLGFAFAICVNLSLLLGCGSPPRTAANAARARVSLGMSLEQTVAFVRQGSVAGQQRLVVSERALRVDREPWQPLSRIHPHTGQVAFVVHLYCWLEFDNSEYRGRAASWYLLQDDAVTAMDHYDFGARCSLENEYRPALAEQAALEHELVERYVRDEPELSAFQLYERGLALANAQRAREARELLERADQLTGGADSFARQRLLDALAEHQADP